MSGIGSLGSIVLCVISCIGDKSTIDAPLELLVMRYIGSPVLHQEASLC